VKPLLLVDPPLLALPPLLVDPLLPPLLPLPGSPTVAVFPPHAGAISGRTAQKATQRAMDLARGFTAAV
jgi:hypothetical protein